MALLLHYTGQDYISRGLLNTELTPGSTSAIVGGCKTGKGFAFDGTVNSGLISLTTINDNTLTMSAWIRLTAQGVSGSRYTIFATSNGGQNNQILFDVSNVNRLRLVILFDDHGADVCDSITNNSIQINTWYHVVATINKTTRRIQLFINGILVNSLVYSNKQLQTTDRFFVGRRRLADAAFNGQICNLKVYNHVLSAREIAEDYKSLMLHYKLDKPITDTVLDVSGFKRHITNLTANTVTLDSKAQVYSASLKNDGTQRLLGTSDLTDLNGIPEISISFRVYKQNTDMGAILTNRTVAGNGIAIFILSTQIYVDISQRNKHSYAIPLNEWVNICVTQSATEQKLYANGVLVSTMTAKTLSGIDSYTSISNSNVAGGAIEYELKGNIQDIRFYATALTDKDVKDLYNVRHSIDKNGNYYTYELIEGETGVGMKKNGITNCDEIIEGDDGVFKIVKSNKTIKTKEIKEI